MTGDKKCTDALRFVGSIIKGRGRHSELGVPGRKALAECPDSWPQRLCPGSLNVRIDEYPAAFDERGLPHSVKALDTAGFDPSFVIPWNEMERNRLTPRPESPRRGTAQVWTAVLDWKDESLDCWVLRRIGSGLGKELEIVSGIRIRERFNLYPQEENFPVSVTLYGRWKTCGPV